MRIGIVTPVVTRVPGAHGHWERTATRDDVVAIARAADELGFDYLTASDHAAVPAPVAEVRGATYWDALATLSYLAAHTTRIRLATHVLVLGYHHPLALAKAYGTLDVLSDGRVVLGVGVGSLQEEFDALGAPFDDRGARADDALRALRASLSVSVATYEGTHHRYRDMVVDPHAVQPHMPIWVGGRTARSLRRAVELADGWVPFGLDPAQLRSMLAAVDIPDGFDLALSPTRAFDAVDRPAAAVDAIGELAAIGATAINARVFARSREHYVEQLHALAPLSGEQR